MAQDKNSVTRMLADYLEDLDRAGISDLRSSRPDSTPQTAPNQNDSGRKDSNRSSRPSTARQSAARPAPAPAPQASAPQTSGPSASGPQVSGPPPKLDLPIIYPEVRQIVESGKGRIETLDLLAAEVGKCTRCPDLVANRTQTVFGSGNPDSELVFIGEGPGADEDQQGKPFVGRSGQLLTDIITKGMRLRREDVYICNIVRCRPPGNRTPNTTEAQCCRPFLEATLQTIAPKYICCLGATAATGLLGIQQAMGKFRGIVHDFHGIKVVCTYHPAYLLRNPPAKTQTWEDIQLLMREMKLM